MKTCHKNVIAVIGIGVLSFFSFAANAEVKVIVNANVRATASVDQVADIFLGKANNLSDGTKVVPIDQAEEVRNEFYKKVAKKDSAQLKAYWSRLIFTGKGRPPEEKASDAEVVRFVASNPDAIGYVSSSAQIRGVNVLLTLP